MIVRFVGGPKDGELCDVDHPAPSCFVAVLDSPLKSSIADFMRIELGDDGLPVPSWKRSDALKVTRREYRLRLRLCAMPPLLYEFVA